MKIGVFGSAAGALSAEAKAKARELGRQIAKLGHTLVTGACPGLPYEAVLGAVELGGKCIGYSPAINLEGHKKVHDFPVKGFTDFVFVPDIEQLKEPLVARKYRNIASVSAVDAAVIVGGRTGTMNEFTIAFDLGKRIGVLENSGGITDQAIQVLLKDLDKDNGAKIVFNSDPVSLIEQVVNDK